MTTGLLSMIVIAAFVTNATAQEKKYEYGGVATCKTCHMTAKSGAQFKIWSAGPHAKAFETLKSEKSMAIAKEKGIADPTKADACLKCHVTAHGVDAKLKGAKLTMEEGVGCESCHGPGSAYKTMKVMKDITAGTVKGADYGLIEPTEAVCVTCHNPESPTYKKFVFAESAAKTAHPIPAK
jgi:hypothetical protein